MKTGTPSALVVLDRAQRFAHVCDVAETYFQQPRAELLGRHPWTVMSRHEATRWKQRIIDACTARRPSACVIDVAERRFSIRANPKPAKSVFLFHELSPAAPHVLLVCPRGACSYVEELFASSADVAYAHSSAEAVIYLAMNEHVDMVLAALDFDESHTLELVRHVRLRTPALPVLCCTLPSLTSRITPALTTTLAMLDVDLVDMRSLVRERLFEHLPRWHRRSTENTS